MKNELLNQKQLSPQPAKSASIKNNSNASSKSSDIVDKAIASKKASKSKKKTQSTKVQQPILMVEFDESDIEEDEKEDDTSDIEDHTYLVDGDDAPASPLDSFQDDIWFDAQEFDEAQWKLDEVPFQPVVGLCNANRRNRLFCRLSFFLESEIALLSLFLQGYVYKTGTRRCWPKSLVWHSELNKLQRHLKTVMIFIKFKD